MGATLSFSYLFLSPSLRELAMDKVSFLPSEQVPLMRTPFFDSIVVLEGKEEVSKVVSVWRLVTMQTRGCFHLSQV